MAFDTYKGTLIPPVTGSIPVRQDITGLPLAPQATIFSSACTAAADTTQTGLMESVGAAVSPTGQFVVANASDGSGTAANCGRVSRYGTESICLPLNGTPAIDALARCASLNTDGASLDWTDLPATSGMIVDHFSLGGQDITNAAIIEITPASTTNGATQTVDFGFSADFMFIVSPAVPSATGIVDANMCVGVARRVPSIQQYAAYWFENDAAANMDCSVYAAQNRAGAIPASTAVKGADFSVTAWNSTATITWNAAPTAVTPRFYALGIQGGQYEIIPFSSPTATGDQVIATSFPAKGLLFFGSSDPTDTDNTASATVTDSQFMFGTCDAGLRQGGHVIIQQDGNASSFAKRRASVTRAVTWLTGTAGTVQAQASVSAIGASSFTLAWNAASATVRKGVAVVFGDSVDPPQFVFTTQQAGGVFVA